MKPEKTIAVVLAGGGVTGYFFEAGSVRAMLDCNLPLSKFSGISAGAAVAALAAYNLPPDEYDPFEHVKVKYFRNIGKLSVIPYGLFGITLMLGEKRRRESLYELCFKAPKELVGLEVLEKFFSEHLQGKPKELYISATNVDTGQLQVFTHNDNVPRAIRASCSFPGIGKPTVIDGNHYVDAIVSCTANLDAVADADIIICVNPITFSSVPPGFIAERGIFKIFDQSFRTLNRVRLSHDIKNFSEQKDKQLILIEPKGCQIMIKNPMRKDLRIDALQSGYNFAMSKLKESAEIFNRAGIQLNWPKTWRKFL
jgi:predicted acylesterase/phospholipase RssA